MALSEGDLARTLPCSHLYHKDCIDEWFARGHSKCPLCNMELATPPSAEPGAADDALAVIAAGREGATEAGEVTSSRAQSAPPAPRDRLGTSLDDVSVGSSRRRGLGTSLDDVVEDVAL